MKKNTHFALTITAVSLLHIAGIWALSNFDDKPAELVAPQEELTFVELSHGAPAAVAAPTPVVQPKPEPKRELPPEPEIKRTIVKKPQEHTVVERKPDPKPERQPERKPEPERQPEQKPEQRQQPANNQALASNNQSKGNTPQGAGNSNNSNGKGNDSNKGSGDGKGASGNSGGGDSQASLTQGSRSCRVASYPDESRDRGEAGTVRVSIQVAPNGSVSGVSVVGSSGHSRLDAAAKRQAQRCKFNPATRGGVPVTTNITYSYVFNIKN